MISYGVLNHQGNILHFICNWSPFYMWSLYHDQLARISSRHHHFTLKVFLETSIKMSYCISQASYVGRRLEAHRRSCLPVHFMTVVGMVYAEFLKNIIHPLCFFFWKWRNVYSVFHQEKTKYKAANLMTRNMDKRRFLLEKNNNPWLPQSYLISVLSNGWIWPGLSNGLTFST